MENGGRDSTQEWLLPETGAPPTVSQMEARIDEAVAIARSSEAAAMTVGAAAIESAEQARRAADLAVEASEAANRAAGEVAAHRAAANGSGEEGPAPLAAIEDERMVLFTRRADRVGARFEQLQRR